MTQVETANAMDTQTKRADAKQTKVQQKLNALPEKARKTDRRKKNTENINKTAKLK